MMTARIDIASAFRAAPVRPAHNAVVEASIWDVMVWAFRAECAQLDFDVIEHRSNVGIEYRMIQQARLGCRVDGGGRSDPHPDADVVAATVASLPESHGGRGLAVALAEHAREGRLPDAMVGVVPCAQPAEVKGNRFGTHARAFDASDLGERGWPRQVRCNRRGRRVEEPVLYTPIRWHPTPDLIGAARRDYLRFWAALAEVRDNLRIGGGLSAFRITDGLPPQTPWKQGSAQAC